MADTALERVPFALAIASPKLLKPRWDQLSKPQQSALRIMYGLPLDEEGLMHWSVFQGGAEYDELGYVTSVTPIPYTPKEYSRVGLVLGRRSGKALAFDTPIPTPIGWTTMGELEVGDQVLDEHGKACNVTFVTGIQYARKVYRVAFSDGHTIDADGDHQWFVWSKAARKAIKEPYRKARPEIKTTAELLKKMHVAGMESNWAIELAGAVEYQPAGPLPIDPYLFGVWLGDGTSAAAAITTIDPEIVDALEQTEYTVRRHTPTSITYAVNGGFRTKLRELGVLQNKHIPVVYLRASVEDRIALVQGLIDSDGYVQPKGIEFYNTNLLLANQFKELVESLGVRATIRQKRAMLNGKDHGWAYTVEFQASFPVARLPRKLAKQRRLDSEKKRFRYIEAIEEISSVPVKCIQVDSPSHLYLAGQGFIPTHNTNQIVSTAVAYEATLGGHARYVQPKQSFKTLFLAQTAGDAQQNMNFIRHAIDMCPGLVGLLDEKEVASEIRLKNGLIVEPAPVNKSVGRGHAIPIAVLDESSFYYTDPNAANPDYEALRAIRYAQAQFPNAKVFSPSTPWAEQGLLWEWYQAGTQGRKLKCDACKAKNAFICDHFVEEREEFSDTLVLHASTAFMESLDAVLGSRDKARRQLERLRREDPEAFPRESLALFIKTISGWLSPAKIATAIDTGVSSRLRQPRATYIAAMDPAFRNDSFAFTVLHHDPKLGIVQDWVEYWEPEPGIPLKPGNILDQIKLRLDQFGISVVYSDQYQLESLQQLALDRGFSINGYDFTGKSKSVITGGFRMLLNEERLRLLDHELQRDQLEKLQKRVMQSGTVQIAAPPGKHDDLAMVLMLATRIALWLMTEEQSTEERPLDVDTDHVKMFLQQIERKRQEEERWAA